jgi:hypothetical protein
MHMHFNALSHRRGPSAQRNGPGEGDSAVREYLESSWQQQPPVRWLFDLKHQYRVRL